MRTFHTEVPQHPHPLGHQAEGRVRLYLVKYLHCPGETVFYPVQETGRGQERVCNDEDPLPGQLVQRGHGLRSKIEFGLDPKGFHGFCLPFP